MLDFFSDAEFEEAKYRIIEHTLSDSMNPRKHPYCNLVVGQPGAGKTRLVNISMEELSGDAVYINGDSYLKFHPRYEDLQKRYGDKSVIHTQQFSARMTEALIEELSNRRYNLIIEGTLRTTLVPVKTKQLLEGKGYTVSLLAMLVRPEISYLSTIKRYAMMKETGLVPRKTPKEHHDLVVSAIADNIHVLYKQRHFEDIRIYNRQGDLLYDCMETPSTNPSHLFIEEFSRDLSTKERENIFKEYQGYADKEEIQSVLESYGRGGGR